MPGSRTCAQSLSYPLKNTTESDQRVILNNCQGQSESHISNLMGEQINQNSLNASRAQDAANGQIKTQGSSMHCTMPSFSQGISGNLNLDEIQKAKLSSSVVDISELSRGADRPQRSTSQAKLDSVSNKSLHQSLASNKQMVNIKSYCDIGRQMIGVSSTGGYQSQSHGHSSLTREGRRGASQHQHHTQQTNQDCSTNQPIHSNQLNSNYQSTTSKQNILVTKGDMNTLTHVSSGYRDGKECSESRDAFINSSHQIKSSSKLQSTENRQSLLNQQYTLSQQNLERSNRVSVGPNENSKQRTSQATIDNIDGDSQQDIRINRVNAQLNQNENAKKRLIEVKDVLKNSKTLKQQLKGVCSCYDQFISVQSEKEDQKSMSLMKNFFLQIVNKSQGEILKYKQAYESQRERRKVCEAKLAERSDNIEKYQEKNFQETQKLSKMYNEKEKQYTIKIQDQSDVIRQLEEQIKTLQNNQITRTNGAAMSLQPVATGVVSNIQQQTKDLNSKYSTYNTHKALPPNDLENKENALFTPIQQSKNQNNSLSAQNGRYNIYQDEMHVDHSAKNQNSGESNHNMQNLSVNLNNSVKSVIHDKRVEKESIAAVDNIVPVAGIVSFINSSQCSEGLLQPQQSFGANDYNVFKEINNINESKKRSQSQTAGGRGRSVGKVPPQVPNLDLSRVLPYFSKQQQEEQLKQYKMIQKDLERKEQIAKEKVRRDEVNQSVVHTQGSQGYNKPTIQMNKSQQQFSSLTSLQPSSQNSSSVMVCNTAVMTGTSAQAASQAQLPSKKSNPNLLVSNSQGQTMNMGGPPVVPLLDFSKLK